MVNGGCLLVELLLPGLGVLFGHCSVLGLLLAVCAVVNMVLG